MIIRLLGFLLLCFQSMAQPDMDWLVVIPRPSSADSSFSPSSIPNLYLWFDASTNIYDAVSGGNVITVDGTEVRRWINKLGAQHIEPYFSGAETTGPVYKTGILNGKPVLRFDGNLSAMSGGMARCNQPFTIFMVFKIYASTGYNVIMEGVSTARGMFAVYPANTWDIWVSNGADVSIGTYNNDWNVWCCTYNGAASQYSFNSTNRTTVTSSPGSNAYDPLTFGSDYNNTAHGQVDIAEYLLYQDDVQATNVTWLIRHLGTKYGITIN
jgi:hypothetical protein